MKTLKKLCRIESLNFLLTNRVPRMALTRFMGWFSKIEVPWVRDGSMAVWRAFSDLDLSESKAQRFRSLHECFIRELKPDARAIDPDPGILTSPCDAIVCAAGVVERGTLIQAKGLTYSLAELVGDAGLAAVHEGTPYATLRLTSSMYHRFHAPGNGEVCRVHYISGDTWNVNPPALKRIARLYCRNERAVIETVLAGGGRLTLVPVAAILVASIRLNFLDVLLHLRYRGPHRVETSVAVRKGEELGRFEHGSTIVVLGPIGARLAPGIRPDLRVYMGQALMQLAGR